MTATVLLTGMLKDYHHGERLATIEAGISVVEAMRSLGIPSELVALVLINDRAASKTDLIVDGDRVQLLAVIGGG